MLNHCTYCNIFLVYCLPLNFFTFTGADISNFAQTPEFFLISSLTFKLKNIFAYRYLVNISDFRR